MADPDSQPDSDHSGERPVPPAKKSAAKKAPEKKAAAKKTAAKKAAKKAAPKKELSLIHI